MADTTWRFILQDETGGAPTSVAPGGASRATRPGPPESQESTEQGRPGKTPSPPASTPPIAPGAAARESNGNDRPTPNPPATTPGKPNPAATTGPSIDPQSAPRSPRGSGGGALDAMVGQGAGQFIDQFGGAMGKIPYFGKALDLLRKISKGIDTIGPRATGTRSSGASSGAAGQAAAASSEPLVQKAGESAADFLARAKAAGLNPRPATTSGAAAAGAASTGTGARAATGAAAAGAAGGAAAKAAGGAGVAGAAAAGGVATGAAGAAAALAPIVVPVLAATAVVGAAVAATKALIATNQKLRDHFGQLSDRLSAYSREIQLASARIAVANLKQDIEFAREMGGRLARFNESQAKIDRSIDRMRKVIEGPLLDNLNPFLEFASNRLEEISKLLEAIYGAAKLLGLDKTVMTKVLELWNEIEAHLRGDEGGLSADGDILGIFGGDIKQRAKEKTPLEWNGKMYGESDQRVTEPTKINQVDVTPFLPPGNLP